VLRQLRERFQGKGQAGCRPIDIEKNLANYEPPIALPDLQEVRSQIPPPEIPREVPAARVILEDFVRQPIDPWEISFEKD